MRESDETEIAMVENSHQQGGTKIEVSTVEVQEDHICDCLHALREQVRKGEMVEGYFGSILCRSCSRDSVPKPIKRDNN